MTAVLTDQHEPEPQAELDGHDSVVEARRRPRRGLPPWLQGGASTWIWAGLALTVAGFALIAVAWGQVAGETEIYLQLPYVVSAGLTGLALVMVGLTASNVASRHRDAVAQDRQVEQLVLVLEELRRTLGDDPERPG